MLQLRISAEHDILDVTAMVFTKIASRIGGIMRCPDSRSDAKVHHDPEHRGPLFLVTVRVCR